MIDIHGLADGQLEGELKASALNELSSNPKAKAEYDAVLGLKKTLQTHCQGVPNDELWKVVRDSILARQPKLPLPSFRNELRASRFSKACLG
ncbi:MAG: hypothetical protein K8R88_02710 [Armatimonadetes bacterium]|nr:hypothetical protein [Armatimonadota bacterium]